MAEITDIAASGQSKTKAQEQGKLWRVLIYGNPGTCKTHFGLTMPEPIMFLDTEGKGSEILDKFEQEVVYFDVNGYDEATQALAEALDTLDAVQAGDVDDFVEGHLGTIMVDSMAEMWDWAQQKYVSMAYPGKDVDDIEFQSALEGGRESDWKAIKRLHNDEFRERIVDSDYHFCWTAKSGEDYGAVLSGEADEPPMKPDGEKNNIYKCSELLHVFEGPQGRPLGNLKKTSLTRLKFGSLPWPEFEKMQETIQTLHDAETSDSDVHLDDLEDELGVDVFTGDPDIIYRTGGE